MLHFLVKITDSPPEAAWTARVRLEHLEILNIKEMNGADLCILLSLLAPGPKPLQLATDWPSEASPQAEIKRFISRSNITRLNVSDGHAYRWLVEVLGLSPNLRVLAIGHLAHKGNNTSHGQSYSNPRVGSKSHEAAPTAPHLEYLYILSSRIHFNVLRYILKTYSVRALTLWKSTVLRDDDDANDENLNRGLSQICPVVRLLAREEANPMKGWELFDSPTFRY